MQATTQTYLYDPLHHFKRLREAGVDETLAEIHVEETEKAIHTQFLEKKLATHTDIKELENNTHTAIKELENNTHTAIKELESNTHTAIKDLEVKIEQTKNQILIWTFGMTFSLLSIFTGFIFTLFAKGFHWF
ncbi:MAG: DUF1640 domain-containing protein [Candidatus Margulisbacteria bacterium]|nr:DUF1640 domain-containing protein [Candidatus Margulisiibacteriota bacterium]